MVNRLSGRRALVTGAASGIGRAILLAFRAEGAQAIGLDRAAPPDAVAEWVTADLQNEQEIIDAVADAAQRLGGIDVLVNCAGLLWRRRCVPSMPARSTDVCRQPAGPLPGRPRGVKAMPRAAASSTSPPSWAFSAGPAPPATPRPRVPSSP